MLRLILTVFASNSSQTNKRSEARSKPLKLVLVTLLLCFPSLAFSQTKRVVVVQSDGLPFEAVDSFARQRDPRTGKSLLPWIDHIFYQRGSRLANFYVRGMSLSAPSWSLLNTGQHLQIKGNVEFDRYTLQTYDYLNFVPFYVKATIGERVDMQGAEILDSIGIPLLLDAYPRADRMATFSLFQRGAKYMTFQRRSKESFAGRRANCLTSGPWGWISPPQFHNSLSVKFWTASRTLVWNISS